MVMMIPLYVLRNPCLISEMGLPERLHVWTCSQPRDTGMATAGRLQTPLAVTALSWDGNVWLFFSDVNCILPQEQGKYHRSEERGNVETKVTDVCLLGLEGDPRVLMSTGMNPKRTYFHGNL